MYRGRIQEMVREINEPAAAARSESLIEPLGADGVRAQNPETRPRKIKKSSAPLFPWRAGDREAVFPVGSFPSALPFVTA